MMELRQLRYFNEIYLSGSITQAAENLSMTQPALSQQIQLLERELNVSLFERSKSGMQLTHKGLLFAKGVQEILTKVTELTEIIKPTEKVQQITFATGETLASHFVPRMINTLRVRYPSLRVRVVESNLTEMRAALKDDSVDFALSPEMISEAAYVNRYLIEDQIVPVVSKDFPAASISDWQNLKRCDWILFHSGSAIRKISNQIFRDTERNFVPRVVMEFRSVPSLVRLLEEGVGVGFISKLSLSNKLMVIPLTHLHRKRRFFISYKKKHEQLAGVIETVLRCGGG